MSIFLEAVLNYPYGYPYLILPLLNQLEPTPLWRMVGKTLRDYGKQKKNHFDQ
jgi:hypothetical protein